MLYLRRESALQRKLRFQIVELAASTLVNSFARGVENCKVRISSRDLSPKAEKHPRMQNNRCTQKNKKNWSERRIIRRTRAKGIGGV